MRLRIPTRVLNLDIRTHLNAVLGGRPTSEQVNAVVRLAHALARASLASKHHIQLLVDRHGLNLSDLAYDCIADLFARDERGHFLALESYFAAFELDQLGTEEIIVEFQHLVFGKVKHGIFRLYREVDPQLGKILRNIALSAQALGHFENVSRLGEPCLVPVACDGLEELTALDAESIADHLRVVATGREFIPELLGKIALYLRKQSENSRVVSFVTLALAIRSFYSQKQMLKVGDPVTNVDSTAIDVQSVISIACKETRTRLMPKFVGRKKVEQEVFDLYFKVIEKCLVARIVEHDGEATTLVGCLMSHMPSLSIEQCKREHKNRIEYLARLVGNMVSKELTR